MQRFVCLNVQRRLYPFRNVYVCLILNFSSTEPIEQSLDGWLAMVKRSDLERFFCSLILRPLCTFGHQCLELTRCDLLAQRR